MTEDVYAVACIPAYNEAVSIGDVIEECRKYVDLFVVYDESSGDDTAGLAGSHNSIVVRYLRNLGYGSALRNLFRKACRLEPEYLVTLDADGQHEPSDIRTFRPPRRRRVRCRHLHYVP